MHTSIKPETRPQTDISALLDRMGATASLLCAVHCAALPLIVTLLPLVGLSFLADERVEWGLVAVSALLGIVSLCYGFREHRSRRAFAVLSVGLALVVIGRMVEESGTDVVGVALVVIGGVTVAGAHLVNLKLCQSCRTCQTPSSSQSTD